MNLKGAKVTRGKVKWRKKIVRTILLAQKKKKKKKRKVKIH